MDDPNNHNHGVDVSARASPAPPSDAIVSSILKVRKRVQWKDEIDDAADALHVSPSSSAPTPLPKRRKKPRKDASTTPHVIHRLSKSSSTPPPPTVVDHRARVIIALAAPPSSCSHTVVPRSTKLKLASIPQQAMTSADPYREKLLQMQVPDSEDDDIGKTKIEIAAAKGAEQLRPQLLEKKMNTAPPSTADGDGVGGAVEQRPQEQKAEEAPLAICMKGIVNGSEVVGRDVKKAVKEKGDAQQDKEEQGPSTLNTGDRFDVENEKGEAPEMEVMVGMSSSKMKGGGKGGGGVKPRGQSKAEGPATKGKRKSGGGDAQAPPSTTVKDVCDVEKSALNGKGKTNKQDTVGGPSTMKGEGSGGACGIVEQRLQETAEVVTAPKMKGKGKGGGVGQEVKVEALSPSKSKGNRRRSGGGAPRRGKAKGAATADGGDVAAAVSNSEHGKSTSEQKQLAAASTVTVESDAAMRKALTEACEGLGATLKACTGAMMQALLDMKRSNGGGGVLRIGSSLAAEGGGMQSRAGVSIVVDRVCDNVMVMRGGRVAELITHESLGRAGLAKEWEEVAEEVSRLELAKVQHLMEEGNLERKVALLLAKLRNYEIMPPGDGSAD